MQNKPSLRGVNLLLLGVVCLQAANLFFAFLPQYVRLILNESFFVFLPAYLYLKFTRQPVAARVRWRWPGWKAALLALAAGLGLYPLSAVTASLLKPLLGYTVSITPPDAIPTTPLMAALAVVAFAVMAPLCEEFLMRGVVQPVYEERGPRWAVFFVGGIFVLFHLSLLQGLSILLLALMLGFVNLRTRSLPASILAHFGSNMLAALVLTEGVFHLGVTNWIFSAPALFGGMLLSALALIGLAQLTRPAPAEKPEPLEPAQPRTGPGLWAQNWPLLGVAAIWLVFAGMEFVVARDPAFTAQPLQVNSPGWEGARAWSYEVRNVLEEVVGKGECALGAGEAMEITCSSEVKSYEARKGNSYYQSMGGRRVDRANWEPSGRQMLSGSTDLDLVNGYQSMRSWVLDAEGFRVQVQESGAPDSTLSLPKQETPLAKLPNLLAVDENTWPWQLAGLALEKGKAGRVVVFKPFTWREASSDNGPVAKAEVIQVVGQEEVLTPAGRFTAWRVDLGSSGTAWYDVHNPHTPVKFFNGVEIWYLQK